MKMMRCPGMREKIITTILVCVLLVALCGCGQKEDAKNTETPEVSVTESANKEITKADIEEKVPHALYEVLKSWYGHKDEVDLAATRYNLGTVEKEGSEWKAYGQYTLYKKSGSICGSGDFKLSFSKEGLLKENLSTLEEDFFDD